MRFLHFLAVLLIEFLLVDASCIPTWPQASYTNRTDYLTWVDPIGHAPRYRFAISDARYGGDNPDCLSFNGTRVRRLRNTTGFVDLDAATDTGSIKASFLVQNLSPEQGVVWNGLMTVESTDFLPEPTGFYNPFMQGGIAVNILQHGCTEQGETGFPELRSRLSTWGHGNVYLDGTAIYENVWFHSMLSPQLRDNVTNAIYADAKKISPYSPSACWNGLTSSDWHTDSMSFILVISRWCAHPGKVHPQSDMDIVLDFAITEV